MNLSVNEQQMVAREVSSRTGIPMSNLSVQRDGVVQAYLLNIRHNGFLVSFADEWVEIDPDTFRDMIGAGK